jgi:hypothetical protein
MLDFDLHFILVAPESVLPGGLTEEWRAAINETLPESLRSHFTIVEGRLGKVAAERLACDCVVSPANSFGIMDGGYVSSLLPLYYRLLYNYAHLINRLDILIVYLSALSHTNTTSPLSHVKIDAYCSHDPHADMIWPSPVTSEAKNRTPSHSRP